MRTIRQITFTFGPCVVARDRPDPYAFETLWRQYRACRHNKRGTIDALRFELNAGENLLALQQDLRDGVVAVVRWGRSGVAHTRACGNV